MTGKGLYCDIPKSPLPETEARQRGIGQGFELGLTFGSAYNFTKGFMYKQHSSPLTMTSRLRNGLKFARANCLWTCGAVGALFVIGDLVDHGLMYYRQKDDPFNSFGACAAVAAVATARRGPIVSTCAVFGYGSFGGILHRFGLTIETEKSSEAKKLDG